MNITVSPSYHGNIVDFGGNGGHTETAQGGANVLTATVALNSVCPSSPGPALLASKPAAAIGSELDNDNTDEDGDCEGSNSGDPDSGKDR